MKLGSSPTGSLYCYTTGDHMTCTTPEVLISSIVSSMVNHVNVAITLDKQHPTVLHISNFFQAAISHTSESE